MDISLARQIEVLTFQLLVVAIWGSFRGLYLGGRQSAPGDNYLAQT
jgi:hypothetical protein